MTGIPAALQLLLLPFFPESPRYLLIQKKDDVAAKNGKAFPGDRKKRRRLRHLCWGAGGCVIQPPAPSLLSPPALRELRGWDDVDAETQEIWEEDRAEKAAGFISVLKLLRMRSLRWQVISIVVLMGGQQLSGVNAVPGQPGPGQRAGTGSGSGRDPPRGPGCPAGLTSLGGGLPDLLLRRPDLPERRGEGTGCPVRDGGHRRGQRADDRLRRECPREPSPCLPPGWRAP